ncbi:MAG: hypothetical protein ACLT5H_10175 [Collinsella stercoris]|uniref:hypothetical protein n=1 Tax=Collinsella stercoris TaxID=147206 RepID=UPI003991D5EF
MNEETSCLSMRRYIPAVRRQQTTTLGTLIDLTNQFFRLIGDGHRLRRTFSSSSDPSTSNISGRIFSSSEGVGGFLGGRVHEFDAANGFPGAVTSAFKAVDKVAV